MTPNNYLELDDDQESTKKPFSTLIQKDQAHIPSSPLIGEEFEPPKMTKPSITKIEPSSLMQRLAAFLPEIRRENSKLAELDPKEYSIEVEDDESEQMIEVNLGLGVLEQKNPDREIELEKLILPGDIHNEGRPVIIDGACDNCATSSNEDDEDESEGGSEFSSDVEKCSSSET